MILGLITVSLDIASLPNTAFIHIYVLMVMFIVHLVMVPGNESRAAVDTVVAVHHPFPGEYSTGVATSCLNILCFSESYFFYTVVNKNVFDFY